MLEAGISRAHNIALATLPSFTIPGDISASSRYWEKDIIKPEVEVEAGVIKVKEKPGIGYDIDKSLSKQSQHLKRIQIIKTVFMKNGFY